jgi:hypothetical protein
MEECDEYPAATAALMRIDRKQQRITNQVLLAELFLTGFKLNLNHQASLDSHQWILNVVTDPGNVHSICVRHDVDAIVWQPQLPLEKRDEAGDGVDFDWNCKHIATFPALGYVQASKERKKFTLSSPGGEFKS